MNPRSKAKKTTLKKYLPLLIILPVLIITFIIAVKPKPVVILPRPPHSSSRPDKNSIFINQIPEKIYPFVADLKNGWPQWSASDAHDTDIQYTYPSSLSGRGSVRSWTSAKYGDGTQTITSADPKQGIAFEINLPKGKSTLSGKLTFTPVGSSTRVFWIDSEGSHSINDYMESIMGQSIDDSLFKLKTISEALWKHPK